MTMIAAGDLVFVTNGGTLQHRSPDGGTLIEWKILDPNRFNRPYGMCVSAAGESYVCMDRIDNLTRPEGGPGNGAPGIIKFSADFTIQTWWNNPSTMFMQNSGPAPYTERHPLGIDQLPDGTFIVIVYEFNSTAPSTPIDQRRQVALYNLAADGTLITIWHGILVDYVNFEGIGTFAVMRVARDCQDPNIVWYSHSSQSLFKFNLTTGIGTRFLSINRLLPFEFGDMAPLPGGGVIAAMTRGFVTISTSNNPFSVGSTVGNHQGNTFGPARAVVQKAGLSPATFFADEGGFYQHVPENKIYFGEYSMTDGSVVAERIVQQAGINSSNNQPVTGMDVFADT